MVGEDEELWDEDLEGPRSIYLDIHLSWVIFASLVQHIEGRLSKVRGGRGVSNDGLSLRGRV